MVKNFKISLIIFIKTGVLMTDPRRKDVKLIMLHHSFFYLKLKKNQLKFLNHLVHVCILYLLTNQIQSLIWASLHSNCHHQIVYPKFNLKIIYPPPYERHICHYNHAKPKSIRKTLEILDWKRAFSGKTINERVSILTNNIINIMSNYVPN